MQFDPGTETGVSAKKVIAGELPPDARIEWEAPSAKCYTIEYQSQRVGTALSANGDSAGLVKVIMQTLRELPVAADGTVGVDDTYDASDISSIHFQSGTPDDRANPCEYVSPF